MTKISKSGDLLTTGMVGVGTLSPTSKLHAIDLTPSTDTPAITGEHLVTDYYGVGVSGKSRFQGVQGFGLGSGSSTYTGVYGEGTTSIASASGGSTNGGYFFAHGGVLNYGIQSAASTTNATYGETYGGYFAAAGGLNNYGIYAFADKNYFSGKVGIGTITPAATLDVAGYINASYSLSAVPTITATTDAFARWD